MRHSESLGGISIISFQMDNAALSHDQLKNAIELIGIKVAPLVRAEIEFDNSKFFFLVRNDFNH